MSGSGAAKTISNEFYTQILKKSVIFQSISDETLLEISKDFELHYYKKGDPVFIENELSDRVYFVASGSVEILTYQVNLRQATQLRTLKAGDHFSEFSVIAKSNHSTSCFALEDTELFTLRQSKFYDILHRYPQVAKKLILTLANLILKFTNSNNYIEYFKEEYIHFSNEIKEKLPYALIKKYNVLPIQIKGNTLSVALKNPFLDDFFEEFHLKNPNTELKVFVINDSDFQKHLKNVTNYYSGYTEFSELNLKTPTSLDWTPNDIEQALSFTTIFNGLNPIFIKKILPYFQEKEIKKGEYLFRPNEKINSFYIIKKGELELLKSIGTEAYVHVSRLRIYDPVGEISLLTESESSLFCKAASDTQLLYLDKTVFEALFQYPGFTLALAKALSKRLQQLNKQTRIRHFSGEISINPQVANLLPLDVIKKSKIIPLGLENNSITLGVLNARDESIYETINHYFSKYRINLVIIQQELFDSALLKISQESNSSLNTIKVITRSQVLQKEEDAVVFVEKLLTEAYKTRASDVHLEPLEKDYSIRFRIDGELRELHGNINKNFALQIINRIKILCKMDISENRFPQDAQLKIEKESTKLQARVSSVPSKLGEKFVLRIIRSKTSLVPLNMLASDKHVIKFLRDIIRSKQGLFLITGPTGSGKTTTLYSMLNEVVDIKNNIVTAENPVELVIPGITQIEINDAINLNYGRVLRHILRQDPDTIMVGEIRDQESAEIVFQAALTGHLVFSTLHSTNSLDILPRLSEFKISKETIGTGLLGVMAQRLIPAICSNCKMSRPIQKYEIEILKRYLSLSDVPKELSEGSGCDQCMKTGFYSRIPVFEYWKATATVKNVILNEGSHNDLLAAVKLQNFRSLNQFALQMVLNGLTTVEQVERYLYGMELDDFTGF